MPRVAQIAAASLLALTTIPATAATNAPLAFDCDVAEGRTSNVTVVAGSAVRASVRITSVSLRPGKVLPNAGILVSGNDGKNAIGVQMILPKADSKVVTIALVGRNNGQQVQKGLAQIPLNNPLEVIITIDAAGKGEVQIGTVKTPLTFADRGPKQVSAFCGAGQFRFDPLEVVSN